MTPISDLVLYLKFAELVSFFFFFLYWTKSINTLIVIFRAVPRY